jgi:hypothetical protein
MFLIFFEGGGPGDFSRNFEFFREDLRKRDIAFDKIARIHNTTK